MRIGACHCTIGACHWLGLVIIVDLPLDEQLKVLCCNDDYAAATFSEHHWHMDDIYDVYDASIYREHPVFSKDTTAIAVQAYNGALCHVCYLMCVNKHHPTHTFDSDTQPDTLPDTSI